jgi:uncharacterized membrane protein YfcA
MTTTPLQLFFAALAAAAGGAVNAIAGGGTLITFPTLLALGIPPIVANATSTVALWPGTVGSMWGYRRELEGARAWAVRFAIPSLAGGTLGAILLLRTSSDRFSHLVPFLVLGATGLFIVQAPLAAYLRGRRARLIAQSPAAAPIERPAAIGARGEDIDMGLGRAGEAMPSSAAAEPLAAPALPFLVYQFVVSIYGGYFGAGMGILMLAALGFMGLVNIHQMNGLKNWGGTCINIVAVAIFAASGVVSWPIAIVMAVGAAIGGYAGSGLAQRVPQPVVRRLIIAIGLVSGLWLLVDRL